MPVTIDMSGKVAVITRGASGIGKAAVAAPGRREHIGALTPIGRVATPTDIVDVMLFLASDLASYVHGAVIPVDGGWAASSHAGAPPRDPADFRFTMASVAPLNHS